MPEAPPPPWAKALEAPLPLPVAPAPGAPQKTVAVVHLDKKWVPSSAGPKVASKAAFSKPVPVRNQKNEDKQKGPNMADASFLIPGLQERPYTQDQIKSVFHQMDLDKRSFLDFSDLRKVLHMCGESAATDEEVNEMIRMCDHDASGVVNLEEFAMMFYVPSQVFKNYDLAHREKLEGEDKKAKKAQDEMGAFRRASAAVTEQKAVGGLSKTEREAIMTEFTDGKGMKAAFVKDVYQRFLAMDTDGSGLIGYPEFIQILGQEDSIQLQRMFAMFDKDGSGEIELKELITGLSTYSSSKPEDKLKFAFMMYDEDQSGYLEREEIEKLIRGIDPDLTDDRIVQRVDQIFSAVGTRGSKKLNFEQFAEYTKQNAEVLLPAYNITKAIDDNLLDGGNKPR